MAVGDLGQHGDDARQLLCAGRAVGDSLRGKGAQQGAEAFAEIAPGSRQHLDVHAAANRLAPRLAAERSCHRARALEPRDDLLQVAEHGGRQARPDQLVEQRDRRVGLGRQVCEQDLRVLVGSRGEAVDEAADGADEVGLALQLIPDEEQEPLALGGRELGAGTDGKSLDGKCQLVLREQEIELDGRLLHVV